MKCRNLRAAFSVHLLAQSARISARVFFIPAAMLPPSFVFEMITVSFVNRAELFCILCNAERATSTKYLAIVACFLPPDEVWGCKDLCEWTWAKVDQSVIQITDAASLVSVPLANTVRLPSMEAGAFERAASSVRPGVMPVLWPIEGSFQLPSIFDSMEATIAFDLFGVHGHTSANVR